MSENYLLAVMEAVSNSVAAGSNQQLADSSTTTLDVKLEQNEYNDWTAKVQAQAAEVKKWADKVAKDPSNKDYQYQLSAAQTAFQNTETEMQTYTQQADSATQVMQNQTGQDATTEQQKVQLEAAINVILQALASALGQRY